MQMISFNKKGITLIALVITIVVFMIILGITLNYGLSEIHDVTNKKTESELSIVQEAIMQRYAKVKSSNELGKIAPGINSDSQLSSDEGRPSGFVGTRLCSSSQISSNGFPSVTPMVVYEKNCNDKTYEEYYYLLNEADLVDLGIEKGDNTNVSGDASTKELSYIVNYSTGEVFDIAKKKYHATDTNDGDPVYKQPTDVTTNQVEYDFNDD